LPLLHPCWPPTSPYRGKPRFGAIGNLHCVRLPVKDREEGQMEEKTVRDHLAEVREALKRNEEEREVLLALLRGYEGWLRLRGSNGATQLILAEPKAAPAVPKGAVSFRSAVLTVLREAHGEPLHSREILKRVLSMGATTTAKQPQAITDLMCYSLRDAYPIKKVGPRTWAWISEPQGPSEAFESPPQDGSRMVGPAGPRQPIEGE